MKRRWMAVSAGVCFMVALVSAQAAVEFEHEVVIAGPENVKGGLVAVDASAPGEVDIAWRHANGSTRYTRWVRERADENQGKVVDGETVCGLTHCIYGISRDEGTVRIGANNHKRIIEWTRQEDGTWEASPTGVTAPQYYGAIGAYDVNPLTGRGGFYVLDNQGQSVYVARQEDGSWKVQVLQTNQKPNTRGSFTFTPAGDPVVAYQVLRKPAVLVAGKVGQTTAGIAAAYDWFPLDVAADEEGGIHLAVARHIGATDYHVSTDGGQTWKSFLILDSATYGDAPAIRIAVAPGRRMVAVVLSDRSGALHLATSTDGGQTWELQPLPGGRSQFPDVAFDSAGALYVVYFDGESKQLKLLVDDNPLPAGG